MSTKQLHLLRHAKSDWDDPSLPDHDRPLAARGRKAAPLIAHYMKEVALPVDLVLCSTARRARQTLSLILPVLDGIPVIYEQSIYTFDAPALIDRLRVLDETVNTALVVGHNPALEETIMSLCQPSDTLPETPPSLLTAVASKFPTAALASIEFPGPWAQLGLPAAPQAHLTRFVRPKDLIKQLS